MSRLAVKQRGLHMVERVGGELLCCKSGAFNL